MQIFYLLVCASATRLASEVSPIEKVLQLLGELEAKIIKDGEETQKLYEEFTDYCKGTSKDTQFAIKTGKSAAERFAAQIDSSGAEITELETKIGELSSSVASNSKDLAAATEIRKTEVADYEEADKDLMETVDMLRRAIAILEKEMSKTGFIQTDAMNKVADALATLVSAGAVRGVSQTDQARLQAFLQGGDSDMQPAGAPAPAAYEGQSGGIVSAMEDMLEKAEAQRAAGQKAEMEAAHNFAMLKQSLEDAMKAENKELSESKKGKAIAEETKATAEGELERTNKEIAADQEKLKDLQHECMTKAEEHEEESMERNNELGALAAAKKVLNEKTGGAAKRTYGDGEEEPSFLQLRTSTRMRMRSRQVQDRIVSLLQGLAQDTKERSLAQLAVRVRSEMLTGADPFAKVKGMIQEMIEKLVAEAKEEAGHKAFCDKEMSETKAKMEDKQSEVDDLNTKIDKSVAKIAKLKEEIATLATELTEIAAEQKTANEMRQSEKDAWAAAKADFESGLEGVQMALQVLRDYYAEKDDSADSLLQSDDLATQMSLAQGGSKKETGAASGIIGMLEVAESDFSKMLAEGQAAEDQAIKEYETVTEDNKVTTATKETEVKYKGKDKKETEAYLEETKEDLGTSQSELSAIMEYWEKLQPQCVAKPEPYEERKKRREKEIAGLKEAMSILEEESGTSFLAVRRY